MQLAKEASDSVQCNLLYDGDKVIVRGFEHRGRNGREVKYSKRDQNMKATFAPLPSTVSFGEKAPHPICNHPKKTHTYIHIHTHEIIAHPPCQDHHVAPALRGRQELSKVAKDDGYRAADPQPTEEPQQQEQPEGRRKCRRGPKYAVDGQAEHQAATAAVRVRKRPPGIASKHHAEENGAGQPAFLGAAQAHVLLCFGQDERDGRHLHCIAGVDEAWGGGG